MKKILIFTLTIFALVCLMAVSVSATEWFGTVEIIDNDGDGESDINVSDVITNVVTEGDYKTKDAYVKLSCDCAKGEHTFPAYYISKIDVNAKTTCYSLSYSNLNALKADYCGGTAEYSLSNVIAYELPAGYTTAYAGMVKKAANIKYFSFAKCWTATTVGDAIGGNNWLEATGVEEIDIGPYLTKVPSYLCYNCDKLTSVVIPDQIKTIGVNAFAGCAMLETVKISRNSQLETLEAQCFRDSTKIGAFYIPAGLKTLGVAGSGSAPFVGCTNLYFVADPDETTKPSVYYFPKNITSIVGETFKSCKNLNDVLVFHSGITEVKDGWAFNSTNAVKLVFLGNMTEISTSGNAWNSKITIYFCNGNDRSTADVTMTTNAGKVFCFADGNTTHLLEKTLSTDATCTSAATTANYCFCGSIIGEAVTEGEALGHSFEGGEITYVFGATIYDGASSCTACVRNCGTNSEVTELGPIITEKGYSSSDIGGVKSFTRGYDVNVELLGFYESQKKVSVEIGFGFGLAANMDTSAELTLDSFAVNMVLKESGKEYSAKELNYIVRYKNDTYVDTMVVIAGYVSENGEVTFSDMIEEVSYNSVAGLGGVTVTPDGEGGGTVEGGMDMDDLLGSN